MRWNIPTNRLAFMAPGIDGHYRVHTMRPDGTDTRDLTGQASGLPPGHHGMVYWHPSGRYLMFTAQKPEWKGRALFGAPDYEALPGFGRHDDIWLATADGGRFWKLTDEPNTPDEGALLPVFAPNGARVAWSARQPGGTYVLKVADFVETPDPHLANIQTFRPGGGTYFEPGSFTSDSASLIYSGDQESHSFWRSQIHRLDLMTGQSTRLTQGRDYNEHPTVIPTPSGDRIIYMSTKGVARRRWHWFLGTDWYVMRLDGGDARRLTWMNSDRPDNAENEGRMLVATTVAISPSGTFMLGDVQDSLTRQTGLVKIVRFRCR